jgi:hypothetical protein
MMLKNYNKQCLITKILLAYGLLVLTGCSEEIPESYEACDRRYSETERVSKSRSIGDPRLKYSFFSGEFSIKPGQKKTRSSKVVASMEERFFYEYCSTDRGMFSAACPYFAECVSSVKHSKENSPEAFRILSFEEIAHVLRDDRLERGKLSLSVRSPEEKVYKYSGRPLVNVWNFRSACKATTSTYNSEVVAGSIFRNVPEVKSWEDALELGIKAVKGFGICSCVLSEFTGVKEELSIGYCKGERFFDYQTHHIKNHPT